MTAYKYPSDTSLDAKGQSVILDVSGHCIMKDRERVDDTWM